MQNEPNSSPSALSNYMVWQEYNAIFVFVNNILTLDCLMKKRELAHNEPSFLPASFAVIYLKLMKNTPVYALAWGGYL